MFPSQVHTVKDKFKVVEDIIYPLFFHLNPSQKALGLRKE